MRSVILAATLALAAIGSAIGVAVATHSDNVDVRVAARSTDTGSIEFAIQQRLPDDSWSDYKFGSARFFTQALHDGKWKHATPVQVAVPASHVATPTATPTATQSFTLSGTDDSVQYGTLTAGRWSVTTTGTARYSGCSLWIEHIDGSLSGIEQIRDSTTVGSHTYRLRVGSTTYPQDNHIEAGDFELDPIGCAEWSATFTKTQ